MKINSAINEWYQNYLSQLEYPIYSSYDIRQSKFKQAPVDANIYPAGFNNIHPQDLPSVANAFDHYILNHFGQIERILLITEEHTANKFYWNNILTIKNALETTGRKVYIAFPQLNMDPLHLESASMGSVIVTASNPHNQTIQEFNPQLIISNNDFSNPYEEWADHWNLAITPPRELGWFQRKKSTYFETYNLLAHEFAQLAEVDPFLLQVKTEVFKNFDVESAESQMRLSHHVDYMLNQLQSDYDQRKITDKPVIFIKNDAGTYGLAVTQVHSGQEVLEWGYKQRKKFKAAKGGRKVNQLILQEGLQSTVNYQGASAESVIYMVGCQVVGHFLRYHQERNSDESLNTPGSQFVAQTLNSLNLDNPSYWSARLGLIALGLEAKAMGVNFKDFEKRSCNLIKN